MNGHTCLRGRSGDPAWRLRAKRWAAAFALVAGSGAICAQPAQDLAAWESIDRWQGHYECRRVSDQNHQDGPYRNVFHQEFVAAVDFELERIPGGPQFRVAHSRVRGSLTDSWWEGDSPTRFTSGSIAAPFSGSTTAGDVGLVINRGPAKPGHWMLWAGGKLAQKYQVAKTWHDSHYYDRDEVRDGQESHESDDYPHASFEGPIPSGTPGMLCGAWHYHHVGEWWKDKIEENEARLILVPVPQDLDLLVTIEGFGPPDAATPYAKWIPRATLSQDAPGSRLKVTARLRGRDGRPVHSKVKEFHFELHETSREPGVCMNFPQLAADSKQTPPPDPLPDLRWDGATGTTDAQKQVQTVQPMDGEDGSPTAFAMLGCFDWGAWSILVVQAEMEDGRKVTGHLEGDAETWAIPLPKRTGGSFIADAWKEDHHVTGGDADDNESDPKHDGHPGDGFTLYEEYRGFIENGHHICGDPKREDFFILNYMGADAEAGIDLFASLSGLLVHRLLTEAEFKFADRRMNANHHFAPHRVDQHGVFVQRKDSLDGAMTYAELGTKGGRPGLTRGVLVQGRADFEHGLERYKIAAGDRLNAYQRAIAHELLHTIGVDHHGSDAEHRTFFLRPPGHPLNHSATVIFTTAEGGVEHPVQINHEKTAQDMAEVFGRDLEARMKAYIALRQKAIESMMAAMQASWDTTASYFDVLLHPPDQVVFIVGKTGDEHSGDDQCVMRYYMASVYAARGHPGLYYYVPDGTEPAGLKLCNSRKGTGINGERFPQPRYGDATVGDCEHHICINDKFPP